MIGSTVNPALGRVDYSPITRGAESAAQSIQAGGQAYGQMFSNLGKQIGGGIEQYQKNKQEREFLVTTLEGRLSEADQTVSNFIANKKLYNGVSPINQDFIKKIKLNKIADMTTAQLKAFNNQLGEEINKSRGALAEANAIRQAERDIKSIAENKFFADAYSAAQDLRVPAGVSTAIKTTYRAPTLEQGLTNLSRLSYGKSVKEGGVVPGVKFNIPESKAVPEGVKQFIIVNPVTGAAQLNNDLINNFNKEYEQKVNQAKVFEGIVKNEAIPVYGMSGTYAPQITGSRQSNSAEKIASNKLYTNAQSELSRFTETKKTIEEAQKFVAKDAQGATPAEIKTFVSKDPNLTPLQSASFELVTKPEFRDATGSEKADKVVSEYLNKGGIPSFEFLAKVKTAFKADVEMQDLGGGLSFVRVGNNVYFQDKAKLKTPSAALYNRVDKQQYQNGLTYAASFPTWESTPTDLKQFLAEAGAINGENDDVRGGKIRADAAWAKRRSELTGGQVSAPVNMLSNPAAAPPSGFTPTPLRR